MANMATRISIYADDKASASFRRVGGEADSLAKKIDALNALGPGLRNVFAGLGVSVGFAEAIRQAAASRRPLSACGASPRAAQASSRPTSPGWGRSWVRKPSSCRGCIPSTRPA